jgi:hypothetical protein
MLDGSRSIAVVLKKPLPPELELFRIQAIAGGLSPEEAEEAAGNILEARLFQSRERTRHLEEAVTRFRYHVPSA